MVNVDVASSISKSYDLLRCTCCIPCRSPRGFIDGGILHNPGELSSSAATVSLNPWREIVRNEVYRHGVAHTDFSGCRARCHLSSFCRKEVLSMLSSAICLRASSWSADHVMDAFQLYERAYASGTTRTMSEIWLV